MTSLSLLVGVQVMSKFKPAVRISSLAGLRIGLPQFELGGHDGVGGAVDGALDRVLNGALDSGVLVGALMGALVGALNGALGGLLDAALEGGELVRALEGPLDRAGPGEAYDVAQKLATEMNMEPKSNPVFVAEDAGADDIARAKDAADEGKVTTVAVASIVIVAVGDVGEDTRELTEADDAADDAAGTNDPGTDEATACGDWAV